MSVIALGASAPLCPKDVNGELGARECLGDPSIQKHGWCEGDLKKNNNHDGCSHGGAPVWLKVSSGSFNSYWLDCLIPIITTQLLHPSITMDHYRSAAWVTSSSQYRNGRDSFSSSP